VMDASIVYRFDAQSGAFIDNFVTAGAFGSEGVNLFWSMASGPRDLYVSTLKVYPVPVGIARYSGRNGSLIDSFYLPKDFQYGQRRRPIAVGPDGNLYVGEIHGSGSWFDGPKPIWRFKADTGALIDIFVPTGSGGLMGTADLIFGPDGHLYVLTPIGPDNVGGRNVLRYDGTSGAFLDEFVAADSGGLKEADHMVFGPDGNLYLADHVGARVYRYNGTTGTFIDQFVSESTGEFRSPCGIAFGPDGNLYLAVDIYGSPHPNKVLRYHGTTGALMGSLPAKFPDTIHDLLVTSMDVRLRPVPVLWRPVPRWLQVILPIGLGIVIGIVVASLARISVPPQNLRSRLNQRFR